MERLNHLDHRRAIVRLSDDLQIGFAFEQRTQTAADDEMIVGEQNGNAHTAVLAGARRGNTAVTRVPAAGIACTVNWPPSNSARSRMPVRPLDRKGTRPSQSNPHPASSIITQS